MSEPKPQAQQANFSAPRLRRTPVWPARSWQLVKGGCAAETPKADGDFASISSGRTPTAVGERQERCVGFQKWADGLDAVTGRQAA